MTAATASTTCTISPREAMGMINDGRAVLIDVRTPLEFSELHATAARLMPLDELNPTKVREPDKTILVICRSGARAAKAADKLRAAGLPDVRSVEGGTLAWADAGLPVVRGKKVISLERQVRIAAGALVLLGVILGYLVHPGFYFISAFVGAGLIFAGLTDFCGMGLLLARMPWNKIGSASRM